MRCSGESSYQRHPTPTPVPPSNDPCHAATVIFTTTSRTAFDGDGGAQETRRSKAFYVMCCLGGVGHCPEGWPKWCHAFTRYLGPICTITCAIIFFNFAERSRPWWDDLKQSDTWIDVVVVFYYDSWGLFFNSWKVSSIHLEAVQPNGSLSSLIPFPDFSRPLFGSRSSWPARLFPSQSVFTRTFERGSTRYCAATRK